MSESKSTQPQPTKALDSLTSVPLLTLDRLEVDVVELALRVILARDGNFRFRQNMEALLARIDARTPEVVP